MIKKVTSIRIDDETKQKLSELSIRLDRKISWIINRAITEFIKKNK